MTAQKKSWTVKEILSWISEKFHSAHIVTPLLDAQILLCHVLKFNSRIDLYLNSERILKQDELNILREYIKRRLAHEPVAYIIQQKYWYNLDLYVNSNVLIPRPETESLLDFVLETTKQVSLTPKIIFDFCTGSGCLSIALAKIFPEANIFAFELSKDALAIAHKNAQRNHVKNIEFIEIDLSQDDSYELLCSNFPKADIIVANPPYISSEDWENLSAEVKNYEPKLALIAADNGLSLGKKIFDSINQYHILSAKSIFAMELDNKQPEKLLENQTQKKVLSPKSQHWEKPLNEWFVLKDLENKERFLIKMNG